MMNKYILFLSILCFIYVLPTAVYGQETPDAPMIVSGEAIEVASTSLARLTGKKPTIVDLGNSSTSTYFQHTCNTTTTENAYAGQSANDVFYKLELKDTYALRVSHCGSEVKNTCIYLLNDKFQRIAYNNVYKRCIDTPNAYLMVEKLEKGTYYIVSEGVRENGNITTEIDFMMPVPDYTDAGKKGKFFTYSDTKHIAFIDSEFKEPYPHEVYYRIELTCPMDLAISHCGSEVPHTSIRLFDHFYNRMSTQRGSSGSLACESRSHAYMNVYDLKAGIYYIECAGSDFYNGKIKTTIKGIPSGRKMFSLGKRNEFFSYLNTYDTKESINTYGNQANDVYYTFTLEREMDVVISNCGSALWDTYLYLFDKDYNLLARNNGNTGDSGCSNPRQGFIKERVLPGIYYVMAEGDKRSNGKIMTYIEGTPMPAIMEVGSKGKDFHYTHTEDTKTTGNHYKGQPAHDVRYNFTLTTPMDIEISHCGSLVEDTYVYLLNASGEVIGQNNNYTGMEACTNTRHAYLRKNNLPAGRYTVISEGVGDANGKITTTIEGHMPQSIGTIKKADPSSNYIKTLTPLIATKNPGSLTLNTCMETIRYFDEFGRPTQELQVGITPSGDNLVSLREYDVLGRQEKAWLPAPFAGENAHQVVNPMNEIKSFYEDPNPYTQLTYEGSPLNRVTKSIGPGQKWHRAEKGTTKEYLSNTSAGERAVDYYFMDSNDQLTRKGLYAAGSLYVDKITDEDGKVRYTFTDKQGRLILHRQMNGKEEINTYYVYDIPGNLRYVLPPMINQDVSLNNLNKYAYSYRYDDRNRCILKKLPGVSATFYVYDTSDRLIISQDGKQRGNKLWTLYKYDKTGRLLYTAEMYHAHSHKQLRDDWRDRIMDEYFSTGTPSYPMEDTGYTRNFYHLAIRRLLTVNYYDTYNFLEKLSEPDKKALTYHAKSGYNHRYEKAQGQLTGTRSYLLPPEGGYTTTAYYYDRMGNEVQVLSTNHLGGYEKSYYKRNFTGLIEKHKKEHSVPHYFPITEDYVYTYDHGNRLKKTTYQLNGGIRVTLAQYAYNELGQIVEKGIHGGKEKIGYDYTIRGWLANLHSPNFRQHIQYDNYTGNISSYRWKTKSDLTQREYRFTYDGLNRLKEAKYAEIRTPGMVVNNNVQRINKDHYTVKISGYDKNGNISGLVRHGLYSLPASIIDSPHAGVIDDLTFSYNGNRINKIDDDAPQDPVYKGAMHFIDGANQSVEYTYDANGNVTNDRNQGVRTTYNLLNLPSKVTFSGNRNASIEYVYDATGRKCAVKYYGADTQPMVAPAVSESEAATQTSSSSVKLQNQVDYFGNVIYQKSSVSKILNSEGYADRDSKGNFVFHYYLKDHQGNNRVVLKEDGTVEQVNHYYPFGALFGSSTDLSGQSYKYNGKELDRMYGLDLYDYEARMMNSMIGRFTKVDPFAEKYYSISPYAYCANNPVNAIDPSGRLIIFLNGMHSGSGGKSKYWDGFDKAVMKHLNDYNAIYRDGSNGGAINFALNQKPHYRISAGYSKGKFDAPNLIKSITDSNGNLTETIKIITHSMGSAYGKGYVKALVEYFIENNLPLEFIEFEADFAPYQPTKQKAAQGIKTFQFTHMNDKVANNKKLGSPYGEIEGAEVHTDDDENKGHSITDFIDKILLLPTGTYNIVDGELLPIQN